MSADILELSIGLGYATLALAIALSFVRAVRGPTLLDRVVALDLIAFIAVGLISLAAIDTGQRALIDVAITVALVAFIGSVIYARFLEQEGRRD